MKIHRLVEQKITDCVNHLFHDVTLEVDAKQNENDVVIEVAIIHSVIGVLVVVCGGGGLCERAHGVPYYPCGVMGRSSEMLEAAESWKDPHPLVHSLRRGWAKTG